MKKYPVFLLSIWMLLTLSCNQANTESDAGIIENETSAGQPEGKGGEPVMTFEQESFDFGTIQEGEVVEHTYSFKNTGTKALLISEVQASCGCTVPDWPREPIKPGQSSSIKIQFNSSNKQDNILKDVTVISNANPVKKKLSFTAFVIKKKAE